MTRQNAAPPGGETLARAATQEQDASPAEQAEAVRRPRGRPDRPVLGGRLRPPGRREQARTVPIRQAVVRTHRLVLEGELGRHSAVALEAEIDALFEAGIDELVLDLARLSSIDTTGARVLAMRSDLCRRRGIRVELSGVSAELLDTLHAAGHAGPVGAASKPPAVLRAEPAGENPQIKERNIV